MAKIFLDDNDCTKCGTCVLACPYRVLTRNVTENAPVVSDDGECVSCGHCVALCPAGAIVHEDFPNGTGIRPIDRSRYPAPDQVMFLLQARRSIRAFQDRPVDKALIETILEGAGTGPSPHNARRVEYVVVQDRETVKRIAGALAESYGKTIFLLKNPLALEALPVPVRERIESVRPQLAVMERIESRIRSGDDILQRGAPSVLVLHALKTADDFWGPRIDVTIALQNASLVCSSRGLGSCELGYIEIAAARNPWLQDLLGIPGDHAVYGILAVGYPCYTFEKWIEKPRAKVVWKSAVICREARLPPPFFHHFVSISRVLPMAGLAATAGSFQPIVII